MSMDLGNSLFQLCRNVLSFLSDRVHKEYLYIFQNGRRYGMGDAVRGDFYIKKIVRNLTEERRDKYDPYIFQDKMYAWFRIPLIAEVEHLETFVEGLKSLHKVEICEIIEKDGQLYVNASLGAGPLYFTIFAWAKLAYTGQLVTIKASLNYCKVNANFSVNAETGRNGNLQSLNIDEFSESDVNVCITGFGCLSWLLSTILTLMTKLNRRMVRNLVEFGIERYVSRFLPDYQFPIEGINIGTDSIMENFGAFGDGDKSLHILRYSDVTSSDKSYFPICGDSARFAMETSSTAEKPQIMSKNASNISTVDPEQQVDSEKNVGEVVSKENPSKDAKVASKLERDIWYTNIPLLDRNAVNRGNCDSESDADNIRLEFKFSKNDVVLEDVEPLSRPDMTTCCVFFRSEADLFKESTAKETVNSPFKNSKYFLKDLLTTDEASAIGESSKFTEMLEKPFACDERTRSCNERLMKTFFENYPNFITLIYNACEEHKLKNSDSNKSYDSSTEAEVRENMSEDTEVTTFNLKMELSDADQLSKTVDQLHTLKTDKTKGPLSKDGTSDHIGTDINTRLNKTVLQETTLNLNRMTEKFHTNFEKPSFSQEKELSVDILTKESAENGQGIVKNLQDTKKFRVENVESILKWTSDSESIKELKCLDTKNYRYQINEVSKFDYNEFTAPKVVPGEPLKMSNVGKECSKDNISKDDSYGSMIKETYKSKCMVHRKRNIIKGKSFKMFPDLQRENKNEFSVKHNYISIDQLNAIGGTIFKCFENPWMENPWMENPLDSKFFFTDGESRTFSDFTDLSKRQKSKLAEELDLLKNIKVQDLQKETEYFVFNLDAILEEADRRYKNSHTAELNSSFQSATVRSETSDISAIVKIFFENNPIGKLPLEQIKFVHPHLNADNEDLSINVLNNLSFTETKVTISEKNENEPNYSVSQKVEDSSDNKKGQLSDLISEAFDLSSKDTTKDAAMTREVGPQSALNTINNDVLDDELDWTDTLYSDEGSESSNADILNISSESSASNDQVLENILCEKYKPAPETDSLAIKSDSYAVVPVHEIIKIGNDALEDNKVDIVSESFDISLPNKTLEKQLQFPLKTVEIETEDIVLANTSKIENSTTIQGNQIPSFYESIEASAAFMCENTLVSGSANNSPPKTSNVQMFGIPKDSPDVVNVEKVILTEQFQTKLCVPSYVKLCIHKEQIASLKGGNSKTNEEKDEMGIKSNAELAKIEEQYLVKNSLRSSPTFEESYDRLCAEILVLLSEDAYNSDVLSMEDTISKEEDLFSSESDAKEQKKIDYADIAKTLGMSTDKQVEKNQPESLKESLLRQLHVDTFDTSSTIPDEEFENISELINILKIMFEEFSQQLEKVELNSFTEDHDRKLYSRNLYKPSVSENEKISRTEIHSNITMTDKPDIGSISSELSTEEMTSLWKKSVIVDEYGRVTWKKALEIWGVDKKTALVHPDLEHSNNESKVQPAKLSFESLEECTSMEKVKLDIAPESNANIVIVNETKFYRNCVENKTALCTTKTIVEC